MRFRSRARFRSQARFRYPRSRRQKARSRTLAAAAGLACAIGAGTAVGSRSHAAPTEVIITATATANESRPALTSTDQKILRSAAASADATAILVDPTTGQPTVLPLTPRRPDGQVEHTPAGRRVLLAGNISKIKHALAGETNRKAVFDLLANLTAATRAAPPPATLIVISSGLSTAGPFDLRKVRWHASPASIAARLKARGQLPPLQGYKVLFSGLGIDAAGPQPAPWLPEDRMLVRYWLSICRAAGAASCRADWLAGPHARPRSAAPVPVVPIGPPHGLRGPGGRIIFPLPYSLLFAYGSAALLPSADSILRPIAHKATSQHMHVSITGRASPDGGTARFNRHLSSRRAVAVLRRLLDLGLPSSLVTRVRGLGFAGHHPRDCRRDGHLDEAVCSRLRNVTVVLSPVRPANV